MKECVTVGSEDFIVREVGILHIVRGSGRVPHDLMNWKRNVRKKKKKNLEKKKESGLQMAFSTAYSIGIRIRR
jgi:hypothetical protein